MQMLEKDLIPRSLLLVVIATSFRYLDPTSVLPDAWADECRRLVMLEIFSPISTTTLQTLILLQRYEWHRGSHISAWFISALAIRLAHALRLNIEIPNDRDNSGTTIPVSVRETRRRLMWGCFVMDSMMEAGPRPLSELDPSSIEVRVPCDEGSYQLGIEANMENLDPSRNSIDLLRPSSSRPKMGRLGVSAFAVRLAVLRRQILRYTLPYHPRNQGHLPLKAPWDLDAPFYHWQRKLDEWLAALPEDLCFNRDTLYRRGSRLLSFLNLHCMIHAAYCDLFRIGSYMIASHMSIGSLPSIQMPPESYLQHCRRGRLQNAFAIANILSETIGYLSSEQDPFVAICACLAIRVLVIERRRDDSDYLGITDDAVRSSLDAVVKCAKRTARWSKPVGQLVIDH